MFMVLINDKPAMGFSRASIIAAIILGGFPASGAAQTSTTDSILQITAEIQGLEAVSSFDSLPPLGTYWLALPGAVPIFVPAPTPPLDSTLAVYAVADGQ